MVSVDILGPYSSLDYEINTTKNKFWMLVITDTFTRYSEVKILKGLSSSEVIRKLRGFIQGIGKPKAILCDQGRQFISESFKKTLSKLGIKHIVNTAFNPRGNGITERVNKEVNLIMRMNRNKCVKKILRQLHLRINHTYHSTIKGIPIEVLTKKDCFNDEQIEVNVREIQKKIANEEEKNNKKTNKGRNQYHYAVNDTVLVKKEIRGKSDSLFDGPFVITKICSNNNSVIIRKGNNNEERINLRRIKPFFEGGSCSEIYIIFKFTRKIRFDKKDSKKNNDLINKKEDLINKISEPQEWKKEERKSPEMREEEQ